jgi:HTH-type transcriptional regulator / antitoxin HipB
MHMTQHQLEVLARQLKRAREGKGLSQRTLADRVGIPQGHLSRIENGTVDLQTSTLFQIARALDLELTLIPRQALQAVEALTTRSSATPGPAYTLADDDESRVD